MASFQRILCAAASAFSMVFPVISRPDRREGADAEDEMVEQPPQDVELPSMRDPFRAVFGGLRAFERMFLESKARVEIVMHPLAIFRETALKRVES